jgi:cysteine desulfurase
VDAVGRVDPERVGAAVEDRTGLVHCQVGNHEVGTRQPLADVVGAVGGRALVHADATQAMGRVPFDFRESGVDLVTFDAHRLGGPPGVGVLLVRRGLRIEPLLVGGDQERARRAGMENVAGVAGLAAAVEDAVASLPSEEQRLRDLTGRVVEWAARTPGIAVLGDPVDRLPHLVCLALEGVEPQPVLLGLDAAGVAVHSGSSCSSEALEPSPVLEAMGADAHRSLRVSVGWDTTTADVVRFCEEAERIIGDLRALAGTA